MNSKNMKKVLNAKLTDWLKSIDDESVRKVIKENTIISGGALVSLLTGDEVHDFDVYFKTKEAVLAISQYYINKFNLAHPGTSASLLETEDRINIFISSIGVAGDEEELEKDDLPFPETVPDEEYIVPEELDQPEDKEEKPKYRPVYLTSNAITLANKIQVVIRFWGDVEEIHKNYDFAHCTCSWSSWNNELLLPQKALECIINKELYYVGSKYPLCSIIRTRKFVKRGYTIDAGQYLKMCLQLNELDLKNVEVLKDQLVGVDSTYFNIVITAMQKKQEENPDCKIDNTYVFEIVNRIF